MYTRLCQEFIKMLPHAGALLTTSKDAGYTLVEYNEAFGKMFDIHTKFTDFVSTVKSSQTIISNSLIHGIDYITRSNKNQFIQDQPDHTVIINKISMAGKEYFIVLIVGLSERIQSTIKNYEFFYDSVGDMILVSNQDGRILFSNNGSLLGRSADKNFLFPLAMLSYSKSYVPL